jgi:dienelactone hydrolase
VQGGKDKQVLAADLPTLVDAAKNAGRDITVRILPNDDHIFFRLAEDQKSTGEEYFQPAYLDPELYAIILSWLAHH